MNDSFDDLTGSFSSFDSEKLLSLDIGEKLVSECGYWEVYRYQTEYLLFIIRPKYELLKFGGLNQLIENLEKKYNNL